MSDAIKLKLLDSQTETFRAGTVITAYGIIATVGGRDQQVDWCTSKRQLRQRVLLWQAKNPSITFRTIGEK